MTQELARAKERERVERVIELEAAVAEVRRILTASHSLPHDWTIVQVADAIVEDIVKLRWQVRDTCTRAEKAESELSLLRGAVEPFAKWPGDFAGMNDDDAVWTTTFHSKEKHALTVGDFRRARLSRAGGTDA